MKFRIISWEQFQHYKDKDDILLLDLREKEAYQKEHLPHAIWTDWEHIEENIPFLLEEAHRDITWIILYCERGNTSLLCARDLARYGYPTISLNGGFLAWKRLQNSGIS